MWCVLLSVIYFIVSAVVLFKLYLLSTLGINKCSKHLIGKVVIVTGGNAGIGYATAKDLADRGAKVIIGCRNERRGTTARDQIIKDTENTEVYYKHLDLASFASVRRFAKEVIDTENRLDILINNAGVIEGDMKKTEDGLVQGMQINHFGPFLLTNLLLPLLKASAPSRIINVSSMGHHWGKLDFDNLNLEKETPATFSMNALYSTTKLCNVLMTVELSNRLKGTGVTANSLHPGAITTNIIDNAAQDRFWLRTLKKLTFLSYFTKTPWEGAQTTIYLAVSPEVKDISGKYFSDCKEKEPSAASKDSATAAKLWDDSEKLVKLK